MMRKLAYRQQQVKTLLSEKVLFYRCIRTKKLSSTTVFNIDNNEKCFLSNKSAY